MSKRRHAITNAFADRMDPHVKDIKQKAPSAPTKLVEDAAVLMAQGAPAEIVSDVLLKIANGVMRSLGAATNGKSRDKA